jgi:hypothetical protein
MALLIVREKNLQNHPIRKLRDTKMSGATVILEKLAKWALPLGATVSAVQFSMYNGKHLFLEHQRDNS